MPIEPVGNCQKSGISHGCGYEHSPGPRDLAPVVLQMFFAEKAFEISPRIHTRRRMRLEVHEVAAVPSLRPAPRRGRNG